MEVTCTQSKLARTKAIDVVWFSFGSVLCASWSQCSSAHYTEHGLGSPANCGQFPFESNLVFKRQTMIRGGFIYIPSESGTGAEEERRGRKRGGRPGMGGDRD